MTTELISVISHPILKQKSAEQAFSTITKSFREQPRILGQHFKAKQTPGQYQQFLKRCSSCSGKLLSHTFFDFSNPLLTIYFRPCKDLA